MTRLTVLLLVAALIIAPSAALARNNPTPAASAGSAVEVSFLEVAESAAASGVWRAQNTPDITTGTIREDDKRRSALAFAISGAGAFLGAFLWRWLPCRGQAPHDFADQYEGFQQWHEAQCYEDDGQRKGWDTPTKGLFAAGIALELVSLGYFIVHRRSQNSSAAAASDSDSGQP